MLIDCLGQNNINKNNSNLSFIKDCRENISKLEMSANDLNRENVLFMTIEINGWPAKFAIAKRDINQNEILYGHYGDGYHSLKKKVERRQQSVDYYMSKINKIINNTNH